MLSVVQCDSLISLKGAFHNEGSIGMTIRRNAGSCLILSFVPFKELLEVSAFEHLFDSLLHNILQELSSNTWIADRLSSCLTII